MRERTPPAERPPRLGDHLAVSRQRRLYGRERELDLFRRALAGSPAPFSLFYVHGLGGVGKSAFLAACANEAALKGVATVHVDARHIEATPRGFVRALSESLGLSEAESALDRLGHEDALVLAIDSCDALMPLEPWLRQTLLPLMPARGVVVLAGRLPPSADWTADPALGAIFHALPLRNLSPADSRALLANRDVPREQVRRGAELHARPSARARPRRGCPLACGPWRDLHSRKRTQCRRRAARARGGGRADTAPPKGARRVRPVRATTEALLAAAVGDGDPHELFEWLRGLSFIEQGADGLFPHDLAREVLAADFRWRDPDGYLEMHRRIWRHLRQKLIAATGRARQRVFFDKLFLHRASATGSTYHDYSTLGHFYAEAATARDRPAIADAVRRFEGAESARIAEHWLDRQPQAFRVVHGSNDDLLGFAASIVMPDESSADSTNDPAIQGAWAFARGRGRLRKGEQMVHHRLHMSCDRYQQMSPNNNLLATCVSFAPLEHQRLAWTFVTFADPEHWLPLMRYINFERADEAAFVVGGRCYTVFAHDWRVETFDMWWDQLCERSISTEPIGNRRGAALVIAGRRLVGTGVCEFGPRRAEELLAPGRARSQSARSVSSCLRRERERRRSVSPSGTSSSGAGGAQRVSERREVPAGAPLHVLSARPHAGGSSRAPWSSLQHLPLPPGTRHRADRPVAVGARTVGQPMMRTMAVAAAATGSRRAAQHVRASRSAG